MCITRRTSPTLLLDATEKKHEQNSLYDLQLAVETEPLSLKMIHPITEKIEIVHKHCEALDQNDQSH